MRYDPALLEEWLKLAGHAHDRLKERTGLPPATLKPYEAFANELNDGAGVPPGRYYIPIRTNGAVKGYAAYKTVQTKTKPKLVLATVLPEAPKGSTNLEFRFRKRETAGVEKFQKAASTLKLAANRLTGMLAGGKLSPVSVGRLQPWQQAMNRQPILGRQGPVGFDNPGRAQTFLGRERQHLIQATPAQVGRFRKKQDLIYNAKTKREEIPTMNNDPAMPNELGRTTYSVMHFGKKPVFMMSPYIEMNRGALKNYHAIEQQIAGNHGAADSTLMNSALHHEFSERKNAYGAIKGKPTVPFGGHLSADPNITSLYHSAPDPRAMLLEQRGMMMRTGGGIESHFPRLWKQFGGTGGRPIPEYGRQARKLNNHIGENYARLASPEDRAQAASVGQAFPLHPGVKTAGIPEGLRNISGKGLPKLQQLYAFNRVNANAMGQRTTESAFPLLGQRLQFRMIGKANKAKAVTALDQLTSKIAKLKTELQPHQQRVVDKMKDEDQRGLVVAHGLGSGKTLSAIAVQDALKMPADVVVPASLKANYEKEQHKHVAGRPAPTNLQSIELVARRGGGLSRPLLVVDEAHRLRNPTKTQTALMTSPAQKRLLLTGSPFYNDPSDIAGPVNLAAGKNTLPPDPDEFWEKYVDWKVDDPGFFRRLFGARPKVQMGVNRKNRGELQDVLHKYVDYHPGDPNNGDFPKRTDQEIEVPLSPRQREIYDTIMGQAPSWLRHKVQEGFPPEKAELGDLNSFLVGVRQVANSSQPYHRVGPEFSPKIDRAVTELKGMLDTNPRAKALVFSNFLDAGVNPYKKRLELEGIPYGEFTGAMTKSHRDQIVKDYNHDKIKAMLLSSAGGEGLDLKGTRLIQILEPHWNEEKLKQAIGRGIRYKSHEHLPEDERNVHVQRFISSLPERGLMEKFHLRKTPMSADQYLHQLSKSKEQLNNEFRGLLAG